MFTTCVSRGIPLTVPFSQRAIYFRPRDLEGFFSARIIAYLKRLSMSFPILFSAVPLYMRWHAAPVLEPDESPLVFDQVCFVDGGICSNFPIDFFDKPLPKHPTFAIDLEAAPGVAPEGKDAQTWMPEDNGQGVLPPWNDISRGPRGSGA